MDDWQERIGAVWEAAAGGLVDDEVIARIDALAAERDPGDAEALFERAGARDSAGRPDEAVPLYRLALERGLDDDRRAQATIQLASSLRNLGDVEGALELISAEHAADPDSPYRDAIAAMHALALASAGRPERGLEVAILALVPHMPRYHRSMTAYARALGGGDA
ncbi:tetratricopeptide repeat protein [Microbacterium sp. ASV81]|uniref:Tetratricopeptide repeat protein n=1 Tax=Microbacterium capsulatum TaxID=3041921 RepID=A0ABU0XD72_9MICO|nr:tetratricopeptide repeat protein [Microbacterium sp. ASV81]MDQ4213021.1 tetratricopeptide repeat protein [Microbacterium sp. ASV81]